ncbi:MAG TPA: ABC transporter permease [Candidatus Avirikenella pullistercoris]|nr:ABC transporter permease [Candidatus Avirikenella pullistercoris]
MIPLRKAKYNRFFFENLRISLVSIAGNKLRASLTITIIAIGIMSLVGIITATEAIKSSIMNSFASMGAGSFTISVNTWASSQDTKKSRRNFQITYEQAQRFKKAFSKKANVSLSISPSSVAIVKYESNKTNPNVRLEGIDENTLNNKALELAEGRNFSAGEINLNAPVAIIGMDIQNTLFGQSSALEKNISIGGKNFKVIGILKSKGASMGMSNDRVVYIPVSTATANFSIPSPNYTITVRPNDNNPDIISEAEITFRIIRNLRPADSNDFTITQSDMLANQLISNISTVVLAAYIIGLITILGASVGLMNIMLVSVNEKTKEIGTRMALGAKASVIKQQFLLESVIISQIGGLIGIVLGIVMGNAVSLITGSPFIIPWNWIGIGVALCLAVGILSGYLPAVKASKLDPIEALRYE